MTSKRFNRRQFLRAGSVCLTLPWLESLACADQKAPPRRLVNICTSFGLYGPSFFPEKAGRDYELSPYLEVVKEFRDDFTVISGLSRLMRAFAGAGLP